MRAADRTLLEWIGEDGVALVLKSSLDKASLVRLANARRVNIRGMRNQSASADRLSKALAEKFTKEDASRRVLLAALDTANRKAIEEWRRLPEEEAIARVNDEKITGLASARLVYALCRHRREGIGAEEARALLSRGRPAPKRAEEVSEPDGEEPSGQDEITGRLAAAEQEVERLRTREQRLRQELSTRKFDLNNLRLQVTHSKQEQERLEKQLAKIQKQLDDSTGRRKDALTDETLARLDQIREHGRKLEKLIDKLSARSAREEKTGQKVVATQKALDDLRKELVGTLREQQADTVREATGTDDLVKSIESLRQEIASLRTAPRRSSSKGGQKRAHDGPARVGLFVDVQNVFYGGRQQNARLDFDALLTAAGLGRRVIRAVAYVVETKEINQSAFLSLLQQRGYEVKRKPLMIRSDGSVKGDWDMEIALDVMDIHETLDVVALVTGDGDFTSLVQRLKVRGIEVEVYSFPRNTAKSLRESATRFVPIDRSMLIKLNKDDKGKEGSGASSRRGGESDKVPARDAGSKDGQPREKETNGEESPVREAAAKGSSD